MAVPMKSRKSRPQQWSSTIDRGTTMTNAVSPSTEILIRKVLCPQAHTTLTEFQEPIDQLLPPLTSSIAVNLQLYAIIAVVMRDFVYSWYGKITPDQSFVDETLRIIAHCTRDLEKRLRSVDLEDLILHEIPQIVDLHIKAFRIANTERSIPDSSCPEIVYHLLFPHPALSPAPEQGLSTVEQVKNEAVYRQLLVQGVLAVILPTEDVRNPCLRTLVSDVIADMILGNGIGGKASSGWLIWDGIAKALGERPDNLARKAHNDQHNDNFNSRVKRETASSPEEQVVSKKRDVPRDHIVSTTAWRTLQYLYFLVIGLRYILVGLWTAARAPRLSDKLSDASKNSDIYTSPMMSSLEAPPRTQLTRRSVLSYSVFALLSQLLELKIRMPWMFGGLSLIRYHLVEGLLRINGPDAIFDRVGKLLKWSTSLQDDMQNYHIGRINFQSLDCTKETHHCSYIFTAKLLNNGQEGLEDVLSTLSTWEAGFNTISNSTPRFLHASIQRLLQRPDLLPQILQIVRDGIFPDNALGPSKPVPSIEEQRRIKRRAASTILHKIPHVVASLYLGESEAHVKSTFDRTSLHERHSTSQVHEPTVTNSKNQLPGGNADSVPTTFPHHSDDSIPNPNPKQEVQLQDIEGFLDLFSNQYMNKHMIYSIIELVIVRLVPELQMQSPRDLLDDRLKSG